MPALEPHAGADLVPTEPGPLVPHDPAHVRAQILAMEAALRQLPGASVAGVDLCPVTHRFADGMYVREIRIPQGTLYVGKLHRQAHPRFLLQGTVLVCTEAGGTEVLTAPSYLITPAGTKRVGYTLEDTVIVTVHRTQETDMAKIEAEIIAPDYEALALDAAPPPPLGEGTL